MFVKAHAKDIILGKKFCMRWGSLVAQMVENLPAMQETQVQYLGWEDPGEENAYPLQYSCLEDSMDRGP